MKIFKKLGMLLSILAIISCENNQIYFDLNSQVLKRCNQKGIHKIEIFNDSLNVYYNIIWVSNGKAPSELNFKNLSEGYTIKLNGTKLIPTNSFILLPKTNYEVVHSSNGDAGSNKIKLYLGENNVIKSSKSSCD